MPRCPLHICQGRWGSRLQQVKPLATHEKKAEIPEQFLMMQLADAEEVHNLAIQVIQDFHFGWLLAEEHLSASGERYVGNVVIATAL